MRTRSAFWFLTVAGLPLSGCLSSGYLNLTPARGTPTPSPGSALSFSIDDSLILDTESRAYTVGGGVGSVLVTATHGALSQSAASGLLSFLSPFTGPTAITARDDDSVFTQDLFVSRGFTQIGTGLSFTCGLARTGQTYCWGGNSSGQSGDGSTTTHYAPNPVTQSGLVFTEISVGGSHVCGLTALGQAYCWGLNGNGQLGDGSTTERHLPTAVLQGGLVFSKLVAGFQHTCALTSAGAAYCWGYNDEGQLGDNSQITRTSPVAVQGAHVFTQISARYNSCGLVVPGQAYCWGRNDFGQVGDGSPAARRLVPTAVSQGGVNYMQIETAGSHNCGLSTSGQAYCWGYNSDGRLGNGSPGPYETSPIAVAQSGRSFSRLAGGYYFGCALETGTGQAFCWGTNDRGQLGDGGPTNHSSPAAVLQGGQAFTALAIGEPIGCGLSSSGQGVCWGAYTGNGNGVGAESYGIDYSLPHPVRQPGELSLSYFDPNPIAGSYSFDISGGLPPYTLQVTGPGIVSSSLVTDHVSFATPSGCNGDSAQIRVSDAFGTIRTVDFVCRSDLFLSITNTITSFATLMYTASGGAPASYSFTGSLSGSVDGLFPFGTYTAPDCSQTPIDDLLTLTDASGATSSVTIHCEDPFDYGVSNMNMNPGETTTYHVTGGTSPYGVTPSDGSVDTNSLSFTAPNYCDGGTVNIHFYDSSGNSGDVSVNISDDPGC